MGRILMVLAVAVLMLGLFPMSCTKVPLNESTRNEGLLAEIPFQLYGSTILTEISVDKSVHLTLYSIPVLAEP
jgi:hypothetical protein